MPRSTWNPAPASAPPAEGEGSSTPVPPGGRVRAALEWVYGGGKAGAVYCGCNAVATAAGSTAVITKKTASTDVGVFEDAETEPSSEAWEPGAVADDDDDAFKPTERMFRRLTDDEAAEY